MFQDGSEEVRREWRVVWFPPGKKNRTRVFTDPEEARDLYESRAELGDAPILESRWVTTTGWRAENIESTLTTVERLKAALTDGVVPMPRPMTKKRKREADQ